MFSFKTTNIYLKEKRDKYFYLQANVNVPTLRHDGSHPAFISSRRQQRVGTAVINGLWLGSLYKPRSFTAISYCRRFAAGTHENGGVYIHSHRDRKVYRAHINLVKGSIDISYRCWLAQINDNGRLTLARPSSLFAIRKRKSAVFGHRLTQQRRRCSLF